MRPFSYHDTTDTRDASEGHRSVGTGLNNTGSQGGSSIGRDQWEQTAIIPWGNCFPPFTIGMGSWSNGPPPILFFGWHSSVNHPPRLFIYKHLALPPPFCLEYDIIFIFLFIDNLPPPLFFRLFPPLLPSARSTLYRRGESP